LSEQADFNFCAVGDWEHSEATEKVSTNIATKHNTKFILNLGDFTYSLGKEAVDKWFSISIKPILDAKIPQYCVLGNHDIADISYYFTKFSTLNPNFKKWIYWFKDRNIFFLMLNTESLHTPDSPQFIYAQDSLARTFPDYHDENMKITGITWRIVCFHRPIYCSSGGHSPFLSFRHFHQLFDKYTVDMALCGHNHNYERSYPLSYNPENPDKPKINDTRRNHYVDMLGSIFINAGSGGRYIYPFETCEPHFYEQFDDDHGYLMIGLREDGTKLSGTFYDTSMTERDHFSIKKTSL
jgi:predicted MPP superfamily phosphohydrolase